MSRMLKALQQLQTQGDFAPCPLPPPAADAPDNAYAEQPSVEPEGPAGFACTPRHDPCSEDRRLPQADLPGGQAAAASGSSLPLTPSCSQRMAGAGAAVAECEMAMPIDVLPPLGAAGPCFELALSVTQLAEPPLPPPLPKAAAGPYEELAGQLGDRIGNGAPAGMALVSLDRTDPALAMIVPLAKAIAGPLSPLLVVDCDVYEPGLAERFATPGQLGLLDILPGPARWQEVLRPTQLTGVDLLPGRRLTAADGPPPHRLDLEPLMLEWLDRYRLVLLVPGPLDRPETRSLLRCVHAAVVILEARRTRFSCARRAARLARLAGVPLLGSILVG